MPISTILGIGCMILLTAYCHLRLLLESLPITNNSCFIMKRLEGTPGKYVAYAITNSYGEGHGPMNYLTASHYPKNAVIEIWER